MSAKKRAPDKNATTIGANDPDAQKGALKLIGGSQFDDWNSILANQISPRFGSLIRRKKPATVSTAQPSRRSLASGRKTDDAQCFRELYNAQSVEALKGPSAITFGRNAVTRTVQAAVAASQQGRQMSPIVRSGVSKKGLRTTPFSSRNTLDGRSLDRGWRWPMGACQGVSVAGGGGLAWMAAGGLWAEGAAFSANATLRKTELSTATHVTILAAKQRTAWSAKVGFIFASLIESVDAALMHDQPKTD